MEVILLVPMIRALCCVIALCSGASLVGCRNGASVVGQETPRAGKPPVSVTDKTSVAESPNTAVSQSDSYASLRLLKTIHVPRSAVRTLDVLVSGEGQLVALRVDAGYTTFLLVEALRQHSTARTYEFPNYGVMEMAWHPTKPRIITSGGHAAEPVRPGYEPSSTYKLVDVTTGKTTTFPDPDESYPPLVWLPDGIRVLAGDGTIIDTQTSSISEVPSVSLGGESGVTVSHDWHLVTDYFSHGEKAPHLDFYKRTNAKDLEFVKIATLRAELYPNGASVRSYRTQPMFLGNGKLAFVKVFLKPDRSRERLEIWTVDSDGRNERPWIALPMIGEKWASVPVGWSSDRRILAYAEGRQVKVFQIAERRN